MKSFTNLGMFPFQQHGRLIFAYKAADNEFHSLQKNLSRACYWQIIITQ